MLFVLGALTLNLISDTLTPYCLVEQALAWLCGILAGALLVTLLGARGDKG